MTFAVLEYYLDLHCFRHWHKCNKCSAVAEMGDRLATLDMVRKLGAYAPLGELGPNVTQCGLGRAYICTKWHLAPFSGLATTDMDRNLGGCAPWGWT